MAELSVKDSLTAMEVASYLRRHADFLKEFPDLAMTLLLPREQGPAASLASYQLEVLRDKNTEFARRLRELIEIAHENETLMVRVHTLTLALMRATSLPDTLTRVVASLTEDFHTDLVRLVLFRADPDLPAADWLLVEPDGVAALPAFTEFLSAANRCADACNRTSSMRCSARARRSALVGAARDRRRRHARNRQPDANRFTPAWAPFPAPDR